MAKVELKQPIVQAIVEDLTDAQSAVIVNYCGLTVAQDTELRKQLREAGVIYKVCKNTMMKRAFEGTDFAQLDEYLDGPNAIAISKDDATAPALFPPTPSAIHIVDFSLLSVSKKPFEITLPFIKILSSFSLCSPFSVIAYIFIIQQPHNPF